MLLERVIRSQEIKCKTSIWSVKNDELVPEHHHKSILLLTWNREREGIRSPTLVYMEYSPTQFEEVTKGAVGMATEGGCMKGLAKHDQKGNWTVGELQASLTGVEDFHLGGLNWLFYLCLQENHVELIWLYFSAMDAQSQIHQVDVECSATGPVGAAQQTLLGGQKLLYCCEQTHFFCWVLIRLHFTWMLLKAESTINTA